MSRGAAEPGPQAHLDFLDGWRGIAIALVLANHMADFRGGRMGVEVFFVLSGLLMSRILFETDIRIGTFYQRRIARIVPVLVLYFAVAAVWAAVALPAFPTPSFAWNLALAQAYMPESAVTPKLPFGHLWSLNVEEHSYVLLSLIAVCTRRRWAVVAALAAAAGGCIVAYVVYDRLGVDGTRRTECAAFPLLASAALHLALRGTPHARALLGASAVGLAACFLGNKALGGSTLVAYVAKPFCLALMVNTLHAAPGRVLALLSWRPLRWLGITSYSVYVWQQPFYNALLFDGLPPLAALAGALAVGVLSYRAFEVPMRSLLRGLRLGAPSPVAAARR